MYIFYICGPAQRFPFGNCHMAHHKSTRTVNGIWRRCSVCKHTHIHTYIYTCFIPTLYGRVIPKIHTLIALQRPDKAKCHTQHLHTHAHTLAHSHSLVVDNKLFHESINSSLYLAPRGFFYNLSNLSTWIQIRINRLTHQFRITFVFCYILLIFQFRF